jgi:hypothetical protein
MRRIVIVECEGTWTFQRDGEPPVIADSPLLAGVEAMKYGESLRGRALGYVIRLFVPEAKQAKDMITLHTQVF